MSSWIDLAACRGRPTEIWFPRGAVHDWRQASAVCEVCPVQVDCREYALEHEATIDGTGMWGGLTPAERRAELARRHKTRLQLSKWDAATSRLFTRLATEVAESKEAI